MKFPFVFLKSLTGRNGRNWPGVIVVNKDAEQPAAVFAQELYESTYKMNPINLIKVRTDTSARREMEYMGHEIECVVSSRLYGQPIGKARLREANALREGYDGIFRGMQISDLVQEMLSRNPEAVAWVNRNWDRIKKYK